MAELELPEVQELEESSHDRESRTIGLIISVLAILLAICGALGAKEDNNEIVARVNASNTWAYYQAKRVRAYQSETTTDLAQVLARSGSPEARSAAQALISRYQENRGRYETESKEIAQKAEDFTREGDHHEKRGERFDLAEIFLQIGVVLCSVSILTRARLFVYGGLGFAGIGLGIAALALLA